MGGLLRGDNRASSDGGGEAETALDLPSYQQVNPASTPSACACACVRNGVSSPETVKDQRISSITVTTPGEQQHLVLKVTGPPKRSAQIAAIPFFFYVITNGCGRKRVFFLALIKAKNSGEGDGRVGGGDRRRRFKDAPPSG